MFILYLAVKTTKVTHPNVTKTIIKTNLPNLIDKAKQDKKNKKSKDGKKPKESIPARIRKYKLKPHEDLKDCLIDALNYATYIYDICVFLYQESKADPGLVQFLNVDSLRKMFVIEKLHPEIPQYLIDIIPRKVRDDFEHVPADIKYEAIKDFIKAYKICLDKGKSFDMKSRSGKQKSIVINHEKIVLKHSITCIQSNYDETFCKQNCHHSAYPRLWGNDSLKTCKDKLPRLINNACRIVKEHGKYYILVPIDTPVNIKIKDSGKVVSLDPGERTFQTTYDNKGHSYSIGTKASRKIDKLYQRSARMRDGVERVYVNKNGPIGDKENRNQLEKVYQKTTDKKKLKKLAKVAARLERKAKKMVSELHKKTVKFLTDRYNTILIPKFGIQDMVKKVDDNGKHRPLSKETSRRLINLAHYKFRTLLLDKAKITGTKVFVVREPYTSKTCGSCFYIKHNLKSDEVYNCVKCENSFNRDVNASRNILLHNWQNCGLQFC